MMNRVLRVGALKPDLVESLATTYDALVLPEADDAAERQAFLNQHGAEVEVAVTSGRFGVDRALMDALPGLRAIISCGVGYDTTDTAAAAERGIAISNTPDVLTACVADTAVGLVINTMRGLAAADHYVRAGRWLENGDFPLTRRVSGARVGVLGLGRIGTAIADRMVAFGCPISYHNRREVDGSPYTYHASPIELAAASDVLVIAASGGLRTAQLVDRSVLEALGPTGYLVNVARGSVVDQETLIDLLTHGGLAGAGLDVFAQEPHVPEALRALDNVVLLPHLASGTVETRSDMSRLTLANLDSWLDRGTLITPVPGLNA